jgi:hypothetical protein
LTPFPKEVFVPVIRFPTIKMKMVKNDILMQNKIFLWIALATGLLLLIPLMAMQFKLILPDPGSSMGGGINWTVSDFIVAGVLLFGAGSTFVLAARRFPKHRIAAGIVVAIGLFWLWVELAVGLFTNWGS